MNGAAGTSNRYDPAADIVRLPFVENGIEEGAEAPARLPVCCDPPNSAGI